MKHDGKGLTMRATLLIASTVLLLAGLVVADARADEIEDIINQASLDEYQSYLRVLTGVDPVPDSDPPYYLQDRYSFAEDIDVAAQWILDHFDSVGLAASLHEFNPGFGPNVIGELPGIISPEEIYICCAHYDTVAGTPGCDDNGSGTAAVMMAARILSQYDFRGTIRFIAFSGEEQWMVGSLAYAEAAYFADEDIVAVVNLDMLLHPGFDNQDPDPDYDLDVSGNDASQWLAQDLATQFETYTPLDLQVHNNPNAASDHWAFWQYGYDAVGLSENTAQEVWGGSNDTYHQPSDTMEHPDWDWDFALHTVRGSMAGLALVAGLDCPDDYDCDGIADEEDNCPYHRNPDQADCDDDGYGDRCTIAQCEGEAWCADCNENGVPDECDIADGTSADCQPNGVPDECDFADGTSQDCQPNGVPDECDIADGTSEDENANGVPDECEFDCLTSELAELLPVDGAAGDLFGASVGVSGPTAVVGSPWDDDHGERSGSAYVFGYDGSEWLQETKLAAPDGATWDFFGFSVAISGDTAVIGARADDDNGQDSGSAYVFRSDGWTWVQEAKLLASDGASGDRFGGSVSVSGHLILVGADEDDDNGHDSGSAYIFSYDGLSWVESAKLLASDGAAGDHFGFSVAVSGDTILIGAYRDDDNGFDSGSAYVFHYDGAQWVEQAKLLASDGASQDKFGEAVAVSGDTAVIGAPGDDDNGPDSGAVYVCRHDGVDWSEEAKLVASDGAAYDEFGYSVAVHGDTVVVGTERDDDGGADSGSAYVFRYKGSHWLEQAKLRGSDGAAADWFGYSVTIDGDTALIGAPQHDHQGDTDSGSAYVFHGLSDCQPNGTIDICDINNGTSDDANGNGLPDECECWGDLDGDWDIDLSDLARLLAHYGGTEGATYEDGDLDGDGDVDLADLAALLAVYGTVCD